ncbi:MAG: C1 family peptidase [Bacteroidales bacterium]|nr:C1 family peptidase [Bacteroidales bacterium]
MKPVKSALFVLLSLTITSLNLMAQEDDKEKSSPYEFTEVKTLKTTPVKDQHRSGTCWSFAATSFLETELIRMGKGEHDLSEMFFVRDAYEEKAADYVRYHGKTNFSPGGQAHDVTNTMGKLGLLPEAVYTGREYGTEKHTHGELHTVLQGYIKGVIKNRNRKLTPVWDDAFNKILDVYLGEVPDSFSYQDKTYTPVSFRDEMGLNADNYIELTSYTHHPFYEKVILELPDNWSYDEYYNLPIDELMEVMHHAIKNGYSIAWDGDVSEKGFSHNNGVAILPEKDITHLDDTEKARWEELTEEEKQKELYDFDKIVKEKKVTQELRQQTFNNYRSTDDHLMHLTGIVEDQEGTNYFVTKNSWDVDSNDYGGYLNMSEPYVRMKTIAIMIHKDALPKKIARKLNVK